LNDFFKDFCQCLAREGFVALAPDLYHGQIATTIDEATHLSSNMSQKQVEADLHAAVDYLREQPGVTSETLGVIGFSLGAYWALWLSVARPESIRAVTVFYGTRRINYSTAQAAYLGHFAETDEWEPASEVKKLERSLQKVNRPVTFYTYKGTSHWFFEQDRNEAYNAPAAQLAWERTVAFLQTQLGQ
jgi:carboxymethylenebutenolidase